MYGLLMPTRAVVLARATFLAAMLCLAALLGAAQAQAAGGTAMAWGQNDSGQLGNGETVGPELCNGSPCSKKPIPVGGLAGVTQLSGGSEQTLALLADGTVRAWGKNVYGQLGDGTTTDRFMPAPVSGLANVVSVGSGGIHGLALLSNGTVMAWGDNEYGELGIGNFTGPELCGTSPCSKLPIPVPGLTNVVAIAVNYYYSLALLADGTVMAWGYDEYGELGDGVGVRTGCECVDHPVPVPGVTGATAISAGWYLELAQLADGSVKAWGYNYDGEVGNGTSTPTNECECSPPVTVTGVTHPEMVVAGGYHGLALNSNGSLLGWGYNYDGELGLGTDVGPETCGSDACSKLPVPIPALSGPQDLSAGAYHTLALNPNGTVSAWGYNYYGQLADGTVENRSAPVPVAGLSGVSGVFGNDYDSFAIVGPTQALNVSFAGAGTGMVSGRRILCPANCDARYPQGQVEILKSTSTSGGFAGFSGPCTGTATCQVKLEKDEAVVATFGVPKGTKIDKAKIDNKKRKATFTFSAPGAITGYQCMLVKPAPRRNTGRRNEQESQETGLLELRVRQDLQAPGARQVHLQSQGARHPRRRRETGQTGLQAEGQAQEKTPLLEALSGRALASAAVLVALALLAPSSAAALDRTVSVSGSATEEVPNDTARLGFSVSKERKTRGAALSVVSTRLKEVIAAVQEIPGVGPGDLTTGRVSLRKVTRNEHTLWRASEGVSVVLHQPDRAGEMIGAAVGAGATGTKGPTFFPGDPEAAYANVLLAAFDQAKAKAQALATRSGSVLGPAISIEEGTESVPRKKSADQVASAPAAPPTKPGGSIVTATVRVVFALQ